MSRIIFDIELTIFKKCGIMMVSPIEGSKIIELNRQIIDNKPEMETKKCGKPTKIITEITTIYTKRPSKRGQRSTKRATTGIIIIKIETKLTGKERKKETN